LKPNQLELLIYLMLRADEYGLCFPTLEEIAHELGRENNVSRLRKTVRELETMGFIITRAASGRMYFLVQDPRHAVPKLLSQGKLKEEDVVATNELLTLLKLSPVAVSSQP
jgi:predicted transcriptional regulator